MRKLLRFVSQLMAIVITVTSVFLPMQSYADPGQYISKWVPVRTTNSLKVSFPSGNWQDLGRVRGGGSSTPNLQMIRGQKWITLGRDEVGMLGLTSGQVADVLKQFPGKATQVYARYSPENSQLRVSLVRMEQRPDGYVYVTKADWTPHNGEFYRAYRNFLTPAEKANAGLTGYNPFQSFRGDNTDPVFYNISFSAALVAIGLAMRMYSAPAAWLAVSSSRLDVQTHESGNIFRKTVTTTVDGLVKPNWYFVSTQELQPYGGITGQTCADPSHVVMKSDGSGETSCDAPEHFVQAGVVASQWTGGNMPEQEDNVYHWETSSSSLSILSYVLITVILFWAGGAAFGAFAGEGSTATVAGAATTGATSTGTGLIAGLTPLEFGSVAGGIYAAGSTGLGTNAGITYAQSSYAGSTGAGVLSKPVPAGEQQSGLQAAVRQKQISNLTDSGLTGVKKLYSGNCPEIYTALQCKNAGLNPGNINRPDNYQAENTTLEIRQRYQQCQSQGYSGAELEACASPDAVGAFSEPN